MLKEAENIQITDAPWHVSILPQSDSAIPLLASPNDEEPIFTGDGLLTAKGIRQNLNGQLKKIQTSLIGEPEEYIYIPETRETELNRLIRAELDKLPGTEEIKCETVVGIPPVWLQNLKNIWFRDIAGWRPENILENTIYVEPHDQYSIHVLVQDAEQPIIGYRLTPSVSPNTLLKSSPFTNIDRVQELSDAPNIIEWTNLVPLADPIVMLKAPEYPYEITENIGGNQDNILQQLAGYVYLNAETGIFTRELPQILKTVAASTRALGGNTIRTFVDRRSYNLYLRKLDREGRDALKSAIKYNGPIPGAIINDIPDESEILILEFSVDLVDHIK